MKVVAVFLAAVGLAAAQLGDLPPCATACVIQYTTGDAIAGCNQLAAACICANKDFLSGIACCLAGSCSPEDQAKAVTFAQQICTANGVAVPSAVSCSSSVTSVPIPASVTSTMGQSTTAPAATTTTGSAPASTSATAATNPSSSSSKGPGATAAPAHAAGGLIGAAVAVMALL